MRAYAIAFLVLLAFALIRGTPTGERKSKELNSTQTVRLESTRR